MSIGNPYSDGLNDVELFIRFREFFWTVSIVSLFVIENRILWYQLNVDWILVGPMIIRYLRAIKMNQVLRTQSEVGDLAKLHEGKSGTPTMGGFIICISVTISTILWAQLNVYVCVCLLVYLGLTLLGFIDDYLKVFKSDSKGLSSIKKFFAQAVISIMAIMILLLVPESSERVKELWVPFYKHVLIEQMPLFI